MITLKRLGGSSFALNPDLIERVESTPDTVLVMVDATRYIVEESVEVIMGKILEDRARVLARVEEMVEESRTVSAAAAPVISLTARAVTAKTTKTGTEEE